MIFAIGPEAFSFIGAGLVAAWWEVHVENYKKVFFDGGVDIFDEPVPAVFRIYCVVVHGEADGVEADFFDVFVVC